MRSDIRIVTCRLDRDLEKLRGIDFEMWVIYRGGMSGTFGGEMKDKDTQTGEICEVFSP